MKVCVRLASRSLSALAFSVAAALVLGAPLAQAAPAAQAAAAQSTVPFLNGGIGAISQEKMKSEAPQWPLRLTFSAKASNEYVANVHLTIHNHAGAEVLNAKGLGPLTYVRLTPGEYRITAVHDGKKQERTLEVGQSTAVNFHWE